MKEKFLIVVLLAGFAFAQQEKNIDHNDSLNNQILVHLEIKDSKKLNDYHNKIPRLVNKDQKEQTIGPTLLVNIKEFQKNVNSIENKRIQRKKGVLKREAKEVNDSILELKLFTNKSYKFVIDTVYRTEEGYTRVRVHLPNNKMYYGQLRIDEDGITGNIIDNNGKRLIIECVDKNTIIAIERPYVDVKPGEDPIY